MNDEPKKTTGEDKLTTTSDIKNESGVKEGNQGVNNPDQPNEVSASK